MSNELMKPQPQAPAFMQVPEADRGLDAINPYVVPPRIKCWQPLSRGDFKPGDLVLSPVNVLITSLEVDDKQRTQQYSPQVIFTPLFFFVEYCSWNPIEARGTLPAIFDRSFDRNSEVARKACDPKLRSEPSPQYKDKFIRHVEHLNFLVLLHMDGLNTMPAILGFARGEHRTGTNFASLIKMRNAPLFGCKFAMNSQYREDTKGAWYGIDVSNPPEAIGGFITDEEQYAVMRQHHASLKKAFEARQIIVQHDDDEVVDSTAVNSEM